MTPRRLLVEVYELDDQAAELGGPRLLWQIATGLVIILSIVRLVVPERRRRP